MTVEYKTVLSAFREHYEREPRLFRAPGRVNLIGEHTDYNDGFVLPMAIERETIVAAAPREDRRVRAYALNLKEAAEFDLDAPGERLRGTWLDYVEGVARTLDESAGARIRGAELLIFSDVPLGAGLSSSASLEISTGLALASLSETDVDRVRLALAGQQAEHEYVGTKCGIMDQFASAMARRGHALLIDCRTLEATHIPFEMSDVLVAICDSNVKHELSTSEYNRRREECEQGVEALRVVLPSVRALRDVSFAELERHAHLLPEVIRRRCLHVVTENARTLDAARALGRGDLVEMGRLMKLSHASLRDDYEVSSPELDALVEIASSLDGVLGARMTGGGFGGSTVSLVRRDALEEFEQVVSREYARRTGISTTILVSGAGEGAGEVRTPVRGGVEGLD